MLTRTQSIFKYKGLPDTIPQRTIELYLQCNGNCLFAEHDGNYYVFVGGMGGILDYNYMPTEYIVANPYLKLNRVLFLEALEVCKTLNMKAANLFFLCLVIFL